jgi:preprotein translocase subunit YajC
LAGRCQATRAGLPGFVADVAVGWHFVPLADHSLFRAARTARGPRHNHPEVPSSRGVEEFEMKKSLIAAALMGIVTMPAASLAQDAAAAEAPDLAVGTTVYDPQGGEVGSIEKIIGGNVVVFTGKNRATLGSASFAKGPNGPVIGMTREQLDAAIEQAAAKADAAMAVALVPGAEVRSNDGVLVGSVKEIDGDNVVVDLTEEGAITLKKEHLTVDANGLKLFMSAQQFQAAVDAAKNQAAPS